MVLVSDRPKTVGDVDGDYTRKVVLQPALTAANRQLRRETIPIFYGQNIFTLLIETSTRGRRCEYWCHASASQLQHVRRSNPKACANHDVQMAFRIVINVISCHLIGTLKNGCYIEECLKTAGNVRDLLASLRLIDEKSGPRFTAANCAWLLREIEGW